MWWKICCPAHGISATLVNGLDLDGREKAMRRTPKAVPGEPDQSTLDVLDIPAIARSRTRRRGADRRQRVRARRSGRSPLSLGADVVVYSATSISTARAAASAA